MVLQAGGVPFVVEAHLRHLLPGLKIELQRIFGREGLVAFNDGFAGEGC